MFKSVFRKIFFTYLFILVAIMLTMTVAITTIADDYVYTQKRTLLGNVAAKANELANAYELGSIDHDMLVEALNAMGYTTDSKIYVIKADPATLETLSLGSELNEPYLHNALSLALAGKSVFLKREYFKEFDSLVVFAAYPWQDASGIKGAVLLFSPEQTVSSIVGSIRLIASLLAAAFVAFGGTVIFFFSKRLVKPIREMDQAARAMAQWGNAPDIDIRTKDELGVLAQSFNVMKQKVQKNEKLRTELLSNISHDLRTPITTIAGFAGGMEDGIIPENEYKKYIGIIRREARRLGALTDEIMEAAKIQSGNLELNISRFPLQRAVRDAIEANAAMAGQKHIQVKTSVPELFCAADENKLRQVLYNLINNAIKYSYPNGTITVSAKRAESGIEVSVLDHGEGILENDLPHVFDRYFRAADSKLGGYGLGLSIVKTYVEAHGGSVSVSSNQKEGTLFSFAIPGAQHAGTL